jgi:hypothetical protein
MGLVGLIRLASGLSDADAIIHVDGTGLIHLVIFLFFLKKKLVLSAYYLRVAIFTFVPKLNSFTSILGL